MPHLYLCVILFFPLLVESNKVSQSLQIHRKHLFLIIITTSPWTRRGKNTRAWISVCQGIKHFISEGWRMRPPCVQRWLHWCADDQGLIDIMVLDDTLSLMARKRHFCSAWLPWEEDGRCHLWYGLFPLLNAKEKETFIARATLGTALCSPTISMSIARLLMPVELV